MMGRLSASRTRAISLAGLFSLGMFLPGCARVQRTDLDGVSSPFDDCTQIEGTYFDDRNWGLPYRHMDLHASLWEFLTQEPENRDLMDPSYETVTIIHCTTTGFDATLRGCGLPDRHAHVTGNFEEGYFHIDHHGRASTCVLFSEVSDMAVGIGKSSIDGGLGIYASRDAVRVVGALPVPTSRWMNASFASDDSQILREAAATQPANPNLAGAQ